MLISPGWHRQSGPVVVVGSSVVVTGSVVELVVVSVVVSVVVGFVVDVSEVVVVPVSPIVAVPELSVVVESVVLVVVESEVVESDVEAVTMPVDDAVSDAVDTVSSPLHPARSRASADESPSVLEKVLDEKNSASIGHMAPNRLAMLKSEVVRGVSAIASRPAGFAHVRFPRWGASSARR
jgi:hypothetical protein